MLVNTAAYITSLPKRFYPADHFCFWGIDFNCLPGRLNMEWRFPSIIFNSLWMSSGTVTDAWRPAVTSLSHCAGRWVGYLSLLHRVWRFHLCDQKIKCCWLFCNAQHSIAVENNYGCPQVDHSSRQQLVLQPTSLENKNQLLSIFFTAGEFQWFCALKGTYREGDPIMDNDLNISI